MNDKDIKQIESILDEHPLLYHEQVAAEPNEPLNPDGPTSTVVIKGDVKSIFRGFSKEEMDKIFQVVKIDE